VLHSTFSDRTGGFHAPPKINQSFLFMLRMSPTPLISLMSRSIWPDIAARIFVVEFYVVAITDNFIQPPPICRGARVWCAVGVPLVCLRLLPTDRPLCPQSQGATLYAWIPVLNLLSQDERNWRFFQMVHRHLLYLANTELMRQCHAICMHGCVFIV